MPNMPMMSGGPIYVVPPQAQPGWSPNLQPQPRVAMPTPPSQPANLTLPPPPPGVASPVADATRPKVRAVSEDPPPPPRRLVLPTPEQLGIAITPAAEKLVVDWNQVQSRLERLGIMRLQRDRLPAGGFRVVLGLPTQQVEATGATEAAAVLLALERAEALPVR
jgi:hypothetical protein